ncbi:MAG: phosphoglycolate phosphatase [Alphaproteobacteria bacterium]|nr:phosphoglycolate phosphatase [Alphaproteobacteria bacterium]
MQLHGTTLVFDLDGTLVDTAPDLAGAMNEVLRQAGRASLPVATVRHLVGRGARVLIERGFAETGEPVSPIEIEAHLKVFLDHYGATLSAQSRVFPGVPETLSAFAEAGAAMAVCTNKPHALSILLLEALDLLDFFPVVLGANALSFRKPDPRHLTECVSRLGGDLSAAFLIGDSQTDLQTARAAGVPCILTDYGYTDVPAAELGADALVSDFAALPATVTRLLARAA